MTRLMVVMLLVLTAACRAESPAAAPETEKRSTTPDQVRELFRRAKEAAGQVADFGKPRIVPKGKKPEVIIRGSTITFEGKVLRLGGNIREWKKVLGGMPREFSGYDTSFTWDTLGLELVNDPKNKTRVIQMTLFLNFRPKDPYEGLVTHLPDGTPVQPLPDFKPHSAFAGYLELDGAGIDRDTQVWEVNALAKREKKISCMSSLNKCHAGAENDDDHIVSFATDARKDRGLIYQFTIYR